LTFDCTSRRPTWHPVLACSGLRCESLLLGVSTLPVGAVATLGLENVDGVSAEAGLSLSDGRKAGRPRGLVDAMSAVSR
jgi:hypothetical protein